METTRFADRYGETAVAIGSTQFRVEWPNRWLKLQVIVISMCFFLNMIDGMDIVVLSYIAPGLSAQWHIPLPDLGFLFSAGLFGMMIGALFLAPLADRLGRKWVTIGALLLAALCMLASSRSTTLTELMVWRGLVGLGVGCVVASMAALAAEYAPPHQRDFAIAVAQAGYSIGAVVSGFLVAHYIKTYRWPEILFAAGLFSFAVLPITIFLLPESMDFLLQRTGPDVLARVNRLRKRLAWQPLAALPPQMKVALKSSGPKALFVEGRAVSTVLLWLSMIICLSAVYFVISWVPKITVMGGLSLPHAIYAGAIYNLGAGAGTALVGITAARYGLLSSMRFYLCAGALALVVFALKGLPLALLLALAAIVGICIQGGFNGFYPLAARLYPVRLRSTGLGWALGIGRLGAILGPAMGGILLAMHLVLWKVFACFAVPLLLAVLLISFIRVPMDSA